MGVTAVEILAGVLLNDPAETGAEPQFLSQLESGDPTYNPEVYSVIPAGMTHPTFHGLQNEKPEIPFSTAQIASVLSRLGNFGADCSGSKVLYRAISNLDGHDAVDATTHSVFTAASAFAHIVQITAGHRQTAMLRGRLLPVYDGTNAPLARAGAGIDSYDPTSAEVYELGPIVHGGSTVIKGCDALDIQFNAQAYEIADESKKKLDFAAIQSISPVISFTSTQKDVLALAGEVTDFKIHLARMKRFGEQYGSGESQHILLTVPKGLLVKSSKQGSPSAMRMELHCAGLEADSWDAVPLEWTLNTAFSLS